MTEYKRFELLDGVYLTAVRTDACAQSCLSIHFLTQLTRETAALNAALPFVLRRGSSRLPDAEAIDAALGQMGGASITPRVIKLGELQAVGLRALFGADCFEQMARELICMALSPNKRGGLLRPDWVKEEAAALLERQAGQNPDAAELAEQRLTEEMCCCEDYALSALGDAEGAESIHYQKLSRHYRTLTATSPAEIFYCGPVAERAAAQTLRELLAGMARGEMDEELGTDVRMNSLEAEARVVVDEAPPEAEARFAVGWRLGEQMEDPDLPALRLLAASLEQALRKALSPEVRVRLDMHKGILTLNAPLAVTPETARGIVDAQVDLIRTGGLDRETVSAALDTLTAELSGIQNDAAALEAYWLERAPLGLIYSPEELAGLLSEVTASDLAGAAGAMECDLIYVCAEPADDPEA